LLSEAAVHSPAAGYVMIGDNHRRRRGLPIWGFSAARFDETRDSAPFFFVFLLEQRRSLSLSRLAHEEQGNRPIYVPVSVVFIWLHVLIPVKLRKNPQKQKVNFRKKIIH
jgi:hypothetical protein